MFSSVLPGEYMSGHLAGQIEFPRWLGNNSRRNKFDRIMQELQMHMRLKYAILKDFINKINKIKYQYKDRKKTYGAYYDINE